MYATTFSDNSVLRVDISKFELTCEWLTKHGVKYEVNRFYFGSKAYACFDFISAPQSVIDANNAKFNPCAAIAIIEPECEPQVEVEDQDLHSVDGLAEKLHALFSTLSIDEIGDIALHYEVCVTDMETQLARDWDCPQFVAAYIQYAIEGIVQYAQQYYDYPANILDDIVNPGKSDDAFECMMHAMSNPHFANCSTVAEVKAQYRTLARTNHPDCGGDAEVFAEIVEQYKRSLEFVSEFIPA